MLLFKKVEDLQKHLNAERRRGKKIGFAPTMGALHEGHLELVRLANADCEVSVASVFVNPTQFNDPKDLEKYPRTPEKDASLLEGAGCSALFMPPVEEIYPPGKNLAISLDFKQLDKVMEGQFRPGHFAGMATVVNRLLDIVKPHFLYMGQKDFQQLTIVREMLRLTKSKTKLVMCPTVREADGLAMSSRNVRLSPEMRKAAPEIYQTLLAAKEEFRSQPATEVKATAMKRLESAGFRPEYFEIVDGKTLLPAEHFSAKKFVVACVAVFAADVRLIDNLVFEI